MIKRYVLFLLLIVSIKGYSISPKGQTRIGTIITVKGDTITGNIEVHSKSNIVLSGNVVYYIKKEKHEVEIQDIKEVRCEKKLYHVLRFKSEVSQGKGKPIKKVDSYNLARLIIKGSVSMYQVYYYTYVGSGGSFMNGIYMPTSGTWSLQSMYKLVSKNGVFPVYKATFKRPLKKAFNGCSNLFVEIKKGKMKYKDLRKIVSLGNELCN